MNLDILEEKCQILEKVIIELSEIYANKDCTKQQKALLETMIGAAIWYLPTGNELYSGFISEVALERIKKGAQISELTKEHKFPRKIAGELLLTEKYKLFLSGKESLYNLYLNEFGIYNLVDKNENRGLVKHKKSNIFNNDVIAYERAGIKLFQMKIEEINNCKISKSKSQRDLI